MNLKRRIFAGSFWSLVGNGAQQLTTIGLFIYVARHLTPADVGLVGLAMVFIEIIGFVARWGQVEVLQRQQNLTDEMLSTSFWLLTFGGVTITLLVAGAAQLTTEVAPDNALFGFTLLLLSPIIALRAWTAMPEAILKHRFDYRSLAARTWFATLLGGLCGAFLAYSGYGLYALIAQRLVTSALSAATSWFILGWRPSRVFVRAEARMLLKTGADVMGAGFASVLNQRIGEGMTGFGLGAAQLGLLRLTSRLFDFIAQATIQPVSTVALSTFRHLQHDREAMKRAYLRLTQFLVIGSLPIYFGLAAVADLFVPLFLGNRWLEVIPAIQILAFSRIAAPVNYFFGPAMIALGKTRIVLRQTVVQVFMSIVLIAIGTLFGLYGVLVAITIRAILVAIYNLGALDREIGIGVNSVLRMLTPPVAATAVMVAAVEVAKLQLATSFAPLWLLLILIAIGGATYAAVLLIGDFLGIWRRYVRNAAKSLTGVRTPHRALSPTTTPA